MNTTITFESTDLFREVRQAARANNRTVEEQIMYWCQIGKTAEDNPELPYSFLQCLDVDLMSKTEDLVKTESEVKEE